MQIFWRSSPSLVTQAKPSAMRRITEFEGLRAILAWWVVWAHILQYSGLSSSSLPSFLRWIRDGESAVDVFIILSGFVIFLLLDNSPQKNYRQFIAERFFRIYPLYIIGFITAIILMPLKVLVFTQGRWHDLHLATKILEDANNSYTYLKFHIISHLSLLHGILPNEILPDSSTAFLTPAWSISLEWQFYLIAPLLLLCLKYSLPLFLVLSGSIITLGKLLSSEFSFDKGAFLPLSMSLFLLGVLSYYLYKFVQMHQERSLKLLPFVSIAFILGAVLLGFSSYSPLEREALPLSIWFIALSAAIAQSLKADFSILNRVADCLNISSLQSLGRISYSTYIMHIPIFWVLMWLTMTVFPDVNKFTVLIILGSIGSLSVVALSFGSYYWIEKPFIGIGKQVSRNISHARATSN
jgi:peptidoglycan/LPS O-acetylase OafA/YrhL